MACSVEETASSAVHLHMKPCSGNRSSNVREGSIVVLTLSRPPPRGALEWAQGARGRGRHGGRGSPGPAAKKPRYVLLTYCTCEVPLILEGAGVSWANRLT